MNGAGRIGFVALAVVLLAASPQAHSGPPFPIVSDLIAGPYVVSIWTDPDATDDGTLGGQFWITIRPNGGGDLPDDTQASIAVEGLDRPGPEQRASAAPVDGDSGQQFAAVLMDHEGPFAVRLHISGPRGEASVESTVDATYDLRPSPVLLVVYAMPFAAVAFLWLKLLRARRGQAVPAHRVLPRRH